VIIYAESVGDTRTTPIGRMTVMDRHTMHYRESGKIFIRYLYADLMTRWVEDMHKNVADNYDNVVVIEGGEGSGKSNLAYQVCRAFDPDFDIKEQYIYDYTDFVQKLRKSSNHEIFWMDEGSNLANNRDWASDSNKTIVGILEMMRSRGWTLVICIPHKERLDKYIRENRIRYLAKCEKMEFDDTGLLDRGYFELQKVNTYGDLKHVGYGKFDKMPPDQSDIYEAIKFKAQEAKLEQAAGQITESGGMGGWHARYNEERRRQQDMVLNLTDMGLSNREIMRAMNLESEHSVEHMRSRANARREKNAES